LEKWQASTNAFLVAMVFEPTMRRRMGGGQTRGGRSVGGLPPNFK
jgi:hypothetical protein